MTLKLNGTNSVAAPAYAGDDADTGLQCGTNELKLVTGGSARATVDSDGDLGIGTASPSALLHIAKSGGNAKLLIQRSNTAANTNDYGSILWQSSAGNNNALIGAARHSAENDAYMFFSTASGGSLQEELRIQSAGGISFNGDTGQVNALDDYEEGTWTPSLGGGTGSFNSASWGQYTKIGRRVHLNCFVKVDSMDDTSTTFLIAGVPFTPVDPGTGGFSGAVMCNEFVWRRAGGSDGTMVTAYITDGTGGIRLYGQKNNDGWDSLKNVDFNVNDQAYIAISFNV